MTDRTPAWFEPRLSTGNLITIAIVLISLVSGWYKFDNRLSLAESRAADAQMTAQIERQRFDAADPARGRSAEWPGSCGPALTGSCDSGEVIPVSI